MMLAIDALAVGMGLMLAGTILATAPVVALMGQEAAHFNEPLLAMLVLPIFLTFAISLRAYSLRSIVHAGWGAQQAVSALLIATLAVVFILVTIGRLSGDGMGFVAFAAGCAALALTGGRQLSKRLNKGLLADQPLHELTIVDGAGNLDVGSKLAGQRPILFAAESGLVADPSDPYAIDRVSALLRDVDWVRVRCAEEHRDDWRQMLRRVMVDGEVNAVPTHDPAPLVHPAPRDADAHNHPVLRLSMWQRMQKRTMDIVLVLPLLLFAAPLMLLVAAAIKLETPGPVLFVQRRLGYRNRLFSMYKFRSMRVDHSDADGTVSATRDDARITRVGRFIRATSIDELPQLLNVLLGSMSLVGPRPHALGSTASLQLFWDIDARYWLRHACAPGMTGLAQVRGFRGATHKCSDLTNRLESDLEYAERWSLWLDIKILFRTVGVLIHNNAF